MPQEKSLPDVSYVNSASPVAKQADYPIEIITGPNLQPAAHV